MYVNLEPCAHHGKTPPCVDTIKKFSIPKVVIGSIDPNPKVSGNGVKILQKSGCIVKYGVLKKETDFANRRFLTFYQKKRPYIILKWAKTADDFIAPIDKEKNQEKCFGYLMLTLEKLYTNGAVKRLQFLLVFKQL